MAISPGKYNTTIQRRADFVLDLQFKDSASIPINLTGWTVIAQAWNEGRTTKYADFVIAYPNRAMGSVRMSLAYTQTALFPDEVFYDVILVNPSNFREYYLEGILYVNEGYTA